MDSATPFQPWAGKEGAKRDNEPMDDAKHHKENVNQPKHPQTASHDKPSGVPSVLPGPSSASSTSSDAARGIHSKMDSSKIASMQQIVENTLSPDACQRVTQLLDAIEALSGPERLFLYLRLPTGVLPHDPLKQPVNPLGSRAELQQTITWIQTHLETDPDVSLPKQDVYDEYIAHCMSSNMKPLSTADFGKVMKQVYPTVRPRRLGTRGHSRYCYAGLRKRIKLEVPQLPELGESSKDASKKETEQIVCEWAETKLGVRFTNLSELSRHLVSATASTSRAAPGTPPPLTPLQPPATYGAVEDTSSRNLLKQLKRKIQTHGTPGRPKKYRVPEMASESDVRAAATSYGSSHSAVKQEGEGSGDVGPGPPPPLGPAAYPYPDAYTPMYDVRPYSYAGPSRHPAHPPHPAHPTHPPHPAHPAPPLDYRADPYAFDSAYAPRDLSLLAAAAAAEPTHNLPINLSSDAARDLSSERADWMRRRPPEPPPPPPSHLPARLPLPGKKLILETYNNETQAGAGAGEQADRRAQPERPARPAPEFTHTEYLPKKMRAAEILGGKLAARHSPAPAASPSTSAAVEPVAPTDIPFLEDQKNVTNRSKGTAAALAREEQEAASPTQSAEAPTPRAESSEGEGEGATAAGGRACSPGDSCCGLDGINIKTGMICEEKHSEILNRERVISICNIDKHDLDDYLNEGSSQDNEEELLGYFQRNGEVKAQPQPTGDANNAVDFLDANMDHQDDHSQGNNEKISQLRELLAKNLKNQNRSNNYQPGALDREQQVLSQELTRGLTTLAPAGNFKRLPSVAASVVNNIPAPNAILTKQCDLSKTEALTLNCEDSSGILVQTVPHIFNGGCHNVPQSPNTRTQQYDFVPISDDCQSPRNFHSKSPLGFSLRERERSPTKMNARVLVGGSLQTSPTSLSTAASPFVSPRNTPVPRSRLCPRPTPKHHNTYRRRRGALTIGVPVPVPDHKHKQFAMPTEHKFMHKALLCNTGAKYCQPMSAPPSPNIICSQYKMFHSNPPMQNGNANHVSFLPSVHHTNGDHTQPLSADPLSSEVSQFFQESVVCYRPEHDSTFRSQSVPLKQAINNLGMLYNKTPVGSVPPTPVPNEFCDFGSLGDACDISRAGLNSETLDKIYDAIDSSNDVLSASSQSLLESNEPMTNGCDILPEQQMLSDELTSLIPSEELLDRTSQFSETFADAGSATDNVEEFLKRSNSMEMDLSDLVTEKNKFFVSRSVPGTPVPYKRTLSNLQIDPRRSRELFAADNYPMSNGISSKSVPSTPQMVEEKNIFSYSNRDFLINGNSVEACASTPIGTIVDNDDELASPLHEILREDILPPLMPGTDLLADLDKIEAPYVDL